MNETTICIIALVMLLALFATGIEMSFAKIGRAHV